MVKYFLGEKNKEEKGYREIFHNHLQQYTIIFYVQYFQDSVFVSE